MHEWFYEFLLLAQASRLRFNQLGSAEKVKKSHECTNTLKETNRENVLNTAVSCRSSFFIYLHEFNSASWRTFADIFKTVLKGFNHSIQKSMHLL